MGCCNARAQTELRIEETILFPFEQSLSLHKFTFQDTQPHFSKFLKQSFISYEQLAKAFTDLSLPFSQSQDFYDQFDRSRSRELSEKNFSVLQLQTLILLLCKGDLSKKLSFWFSLHEDGKNTLYKSKVEEMLENLFKVTFDFICGFVVKKNQGNTQLVRYNKLIRSTKDSVLEDVSAHIMVGKNSIRMEEFVMNCVKYYGNSVLSTLFLRDQAYLAAVKGEFKPNRLDVLAKCKETDLDVSFDDLSDLSMAFEKNDIDQASSRRSSKSSVYSIDSPKQENLKLKSRGSTRYSILEPNKQLVPDSSENEAEKEKNDIKRTKNPAGTFLLPVNSEKNKKAAQRRSSYNHSPTNSESNTLTVSEPKLMKRFSIIITNHEI